MKDREEKKNEAGECRMELYMQKLKKQYQAIPVPEEGIFRMEQAIRAMKKQNGYKIQRQRRSFWKGAGMTAAAAAVCITVLANSSASVSMAMEKIPVLGVIVKTVTFRDFQVDEEHYQADVNVPQMSAGDENGSQELQENVAKINANIQSYTDQFVEEFKQSMEENGEGYEGLNISYDVVTDNDKLYSIKVSALQTAGDAVETNRYYHLDKTTGTELTLSNLFRSGSDYTTAISDEIRKQMKEQMEEDDSNRYFLDEEDFPEWNFRQIRENQNFYINSDGKLVIAFDEAEVAPASMGCPEFVIPTEVIQDMLNPGLALIQ